MISLKGLARAAAVLALVATPAFATSASAAPAKAVKAAPKPAAKRPNLFGTWLGLNAVPGWKDTAFTPAVEFTAWGKQESQRLGSGNTPGQCDIYNPVSFMMSSGLFPMQWMNGGNQIVIHNEAVIAPRRIFTDGRKHPPTDEIDPTFLGHAVAHWEGDVLVVDTVGLNGRQRPLNGYPAGAVGDGPPVAPRLPSTDKLHLVERIRLVQPDIMEDQITIEDPKTFVRPFSVKKYFQRRNDLELIEYTCQGNDRIEDEGQTR